MRENFFGSHSPFLQHPLLTKERAAKEVDFIDAHLTLPYGAALLDMGCGYGRHAILLAKRGFVMTAVDPSATMIEQGEVLAEEANVSVEFLHASAAQVAWQDAFDGAICLMTTLGQITEGSDNVDLIQQVFQALKPDGKFMVEVPQLETAVANLKLMELFEDEQQRTLIQRDFDPLSRVVTELFDISTKENSRSFVLKYRLFSDAELTEMLQQVGFTTTARFGNYDGDPLLPESPNMIMVAQK